MIYDRAVVLSWWTVFIAVSVSFTPLSCAAEPLPTEAVPAAEATAASAPAPEAATTVESRGQSGGANQGVETAAGKAEQTEQAEQAEPVSGMGSGKTTLKGGVRGAAILTVDGLTSLEADASMLQGNVFEIMRECTRKETAVMRGPNYIGNGIVIPSVGGPGGTVQIGDLPARRDKLESWLAASQDVFNVLENHMDALILPENPSLELSNIWTGMRSTMQAAKGNMEKMKELLSVHKFDKKLVGRAALRVYDSMTALEKMRSQVLLLVQAPTGKE